MKSSALAVAAAALAALASTANAATYVFTYETGAGIFSGTIDGTLQSDNNTVFITSLSNLSLLGGALPAYPFLGSISNQSNFGALPPATSLDGSFQDFITCQTSQCFEGIGFWTIPNVGSGPSFVYSDGSFNVALPYFPQNWSMSEALTGPGPGVGAVPEPASWAMLIAGFGLIGATMRRRRTALAA